MVKHSKPLFKYLYNPEEINNCIFSVYEKNLNLDEIFILKDFNNFLKVYHKISQEEIEVIFNKKVSNEIKFLCVKAMIDFAIEDVSDEKIIEYFGDLIYNLIEELCLEYEYPEDRTEKYANLYRNVYKDDISYFLTNE